MSGNRLPPDTGPPKTERGPAKTAIQHPELLAAYRLLHVLQVPFGTVFWLIEQRKAQLQDQIDNEESE